jgi:hypothetical protein
MIPGPARDGEYATHEGRQGRLISIYKKALETAREDQMKSILALKQRISDSFAGRAIVSTDNGSQCRVKVRISIKSACTSYWVGDRCHTIHDHYSHPTSTTIGPYPTL